VAPPTSIEQDSACPPDAIEQAKLYARHFVLITDHLDEEAWTDQQVFAEYRKQHLIENHSGIRWLKSEAFGAHGGEF
jgi:hypothetical protein